MKKVSALKGHLKVMDSNTAFQSRIEVLMHDIDISETLVESNEHWNITSY